MCKQTSVDSLLQLFQTEQTTHVVNCNNNESWYRYRTIFIMSACQIQFELFCTLDLYPKINFPFDYLYCNLKPYIWITTKVYGHNTPTGKVLSSAIVKPWPKWRLKTTAKVVECATIKPWLKWTLKTKHALETLTSSVLWR